MPALATPPLYASDLYTPPDVGEAYDAWGANCGPIALAAVLRRPVMNIRPLLRIFSSLRGMIPIHMEEALMYASASYVTVDLLQEACPSYGLLLLQCVGPWRMPTVRSPAPHTSAHWLGVAATVDCGVMYYDHNIKDGQGRVGWWIRAPDWYVHVLPSLTATIPQATGGCFFRWACQIIALPSRGNTWKGTQE